MTGRLILREVRRGLSGAAWLPTAFFLLVATIVPFAVGPDAKLLARIGGGALWIAALTAALLPIERLVEPDRAEGVLDQLAMTGTTEEAVGAAKIIGHWLTFGPMLLIAAVPGSVLVGLDSPTLARTLVALAIGTPALAALAVSVAALTAGLPRAGALAGLLLMPLAVPLVIFGAAATGEDGAAALKLEAAAALLLVAGAPFVTGAAIRAARN
ncbi:heme exporter protein CcmB [Sphingomonas xanthus]|uniref:Heme exporter protein B n=1 Tax=Sphingomonas xanthus TaxID=2594473 RepID=A0A516ISB0_9SPHN|nr:heme exporter protein CcmB [Sphingomonas xanthus]QDP19704.1 heme ABC transporter permease CcmB [Sphingomonas xanthus]